MPDELKPLPLPTDRPIAAPEPARRKRSAGAWLALIAIWSFGLCVWLLYAVMICWLLYRFLG